MLQTNMAAFSYARVKCLIIRSFSYFLNILFNFFIDEPVCIISLLQRFLTKKKFRV